MKLTHTLTCALLAAGPIVAQPNSLRLSTDTAVGVFATDGPLIDLRLVAAGTQILLPTSITATAARATATTTASPQLPLGLGVRITESGNVARVGPGSDPRAGTTSSLTPQSLAASPHAFLMQLGGPLQGRLIVTLNGDSTVGARAGASIDVGADGTVEFSGQVNGTAQVVALPVNAVASLAVRIVTSGFADTRPAQVSAGYRADLTVVFQPDGACQITPYGQGCGPLLGGADQLRGNQHVFTFRVSGAFPNSPVALVFGDRRVNFIIPGTRCPLLANPLAIVNIRADSNGDAVTVIAAPGPLGGVGTMQALPFRLSTAGGIRITSSNGLVVDCGR